MAAFIDPALVIVLLLNFVILAASRLRLMIRAVALQGAVLGVLYPFAHEGFWEAVHRDVNSNQTAVARLLLLTAAIIAIKGLAIPRFLLQAVRLADMRPISRSVIGYGATLVLGAAATGAAVFFAESLPLKENQASLLVIPAALATVLCGFLLLSTRREALAQVLGYIVLENGIFIFGLMLVEAVPTLVEIGVLLDLFVGVFVMGIIIHHVSRAFPSASTEHLSVLKE
jgi:hydrogenase-4 component E